MTFEDTLSVKPVRKHKDGVTCEMAIRPELMNPSGILHGGVIASIADEAAWHALVHQYGEPAGRKCTTTELKVNYLRPITGKKTTARAVIVKAGRTLCVMRIDIFGADKRLAALATVTYMLL